MIQDIKFAKSCIFVREGLELLDQRGRDDPQKRIILKFVEECKKENISIFSTKKAADGLLGFNSEDYIIKGVSWPILIEDYPYDKTVSPNIPTLELTNKHAVTHEEVILFSPSALSSSDVAILHSNVKVWNVQDIQQYILQKYVTVSQIDEIPNLSLKENQ